MDVRRPDTEEEKKERGEKARKMARREWADPHIRVIYLFSRKYM